MSSSYLGDLSADGNLIAFHEFVGAVAHAIYVRRPDGSPQCISATGTTSDQSCSHRRDARDHGRMGKNRLELLPLRAGEKQVVPPGPI